MAVEIATAYVSVIPSARGFGAALTRDVQAAARAAGNAAGATAGDAAQSSFTSHFDISKAVKVGTLALGGIAAAAAGWGIKSAAANEQAQVSFETMLGSAEKAGDFLTQLKDFAAKTPFEFPELQTAASSLISVGVSADKVIPIMTSLGNATSGMGTGAEGVKRATVALQQMAAAGKISAEDLNQLRDAGIPVFELLSAATGKTKEQIAAMAQEGKLGRTEMEQLFAALEQGKGLERFQGLMEKQSATLTGLISTLKDTLGQGLADALGPVVPVLKQLIGDTSEVIKPVLVALGDLVKRVIAPLLPVLQRFAPILVKVATALGDVLGSAAEQLIPPLGDLLDALTPLIDPIVELVKVAGAGLAKTLATLLKALLPLIKPLVRLAWLLLEKLGVPAIEKLAEVLGWAAEAIAGIATAVGDLLDAGLSEVVNWFLLLFENPTEALSKLGDFFKRLPGLIGQAIGTLGQWLYDHVFVPAKDWLIEHLPGWIQSLGDFFKGLPRKIGDAIGKLGQWLWDNVLTPAKDYVSQHAGEWLTAVADFFKDLPAKLGAAIEATGKLGKWLWDNVFVPARDYLNEKAPEWRGKVAEFGSGLPDAIKNKIEETKTLGLFLWDNVFSPAADELKLKAPEWLDKVSNEFAKLPARIVEGMKTGVDLATLIWEQVLLPAARTLARNGPRWAAAFVPEFLSSVYTFFTETVPSLNAASAYLFAALPALIVGAIGNVGQYLMDHVFVPMALYLKIELPKLWESIGNLASSFNTGVDAVLGDFATGVWEDIFVPSFAWLAFKIDGKVRELANIFGQFGVYVEEAMTSEMFLPVVNGVIDAINALIRTYNDLPMPKPTINELPRIEHFATGGRPKPGELALVGERGPELFVPSTAGRVLPADQTAAALGGSSLNIGTVNISGSSDPKESAYALRTELRWLALENAA